MTDSGTGRSGGGVDVTMDSGSGGDSKRAGFLGFVAHEVRNPLSTALWSAELLSRMSAEERGGARGERLSAMCLRSIARVRQLVEDHYLCERLDVGGIAVRPETIPLAEAIDGVVAKLGDRGAVTVDLDPGIAVVGDRTLVERVVDALVAAASADKTPVRIGAREPSGDVVTLVVSGNVPGRDALEDPGKGSPSDPRGRALALPLARRIATALGGALDVSEGGYFLSLPRAEAYIAQPKPAAQT